MILSKMGITVRQIVGPKVEIQSQSLVKIANYAAKAIAKRADMPVIVEDSGLFIKALNGFPGPYSSYVRTTIGLEGILQLMTVAWRRDAYFQSTIAVRLPAETSASFSAKVHGTISHNPAGRYGFGFDPIFVPRGHRRTFGQMALVEKSSYSHRALALQKFANWFLRRGSKRKGRQAEY